ncbi:hypothetical protein L6164_023853 [Bauhinia variegata]|uniref:Uncharacterized protein n=1 Tax=Bauhinia variegata TaxID=167791 RepID=A0ACB9MN75_BAUVA|nr:hypothetical protein L6164_023853 [Bauhinia variegata]
MALSDVCPTEDAVQAFLEFLVDPLLPTKSSVPTLAQQESVAKQMHSVVLLYNYYHRKQRPDLEFLTLEEFCKLATIQRPRLIAHMKFMQKCEDTELSDVEEQLSLTEKNVLDACNICTSLDGSKSVPNIEGWPISKVAVLLIDNMNENCFLLFNSITSGVWAVVEKVLDISNQSSEVTTGTKYTYKKKRVTRKLSRDEVNADESSFLQVGYSAIKEAAGINQTDLQVLESHTVYTHSKEKAASRFFIMRCTKPINHEANLFPIRDLINSLQGPLVQKSSDSWTITPAVEYFHVLPYSGIISVWLSRVTFSNTLQDSRIADENMMDSHEGTEPFVSDGVSNGPDSTPNSINIETVKQKENDETQDMNIDNPSGFLSQNKEKCCVQEMKTSSVQNCSNGSASNIKVEKIDSLRVPFKEDGINDNAACNKICSITSAEKEKAGDHLLITNVSNSKYLEKIDSLRVPFTEDGINDNAACNKICSITSAEKEKADDHLLISKVSNSPYLEKLQIFLASKDKILSETALTALIRKRNDLALQQRIIEDQIALFDKKIQTILTGGEDDLELKIESIIEGCNDLYVRSQEKTFPHLDQHYSSPCTKRRRLSEAVLVTQHQYQELDAVCHENNWILPTYRVSLSDGKFQANVTVKGIDFECSCEGNLCSSPREARDSAAAQMLAKLRSMANLAP